MKTSETLRGNASPRRSTKRSPGPGARRSKCSSPISSASWASTDFGSGDPAGQETSSPWPPSLRTCGSWPSFDLRRTEWRPPCDLRGATSARAPSLGNASDPRLRNALRGPRTLGVRTTSSTKFRRSDPARPPWARLPTIEVSDGRKLQQSCRSRGSAHRKRSNVSASRTGPLLPFDGGGGCRDAACIAAIRARCSDAFLVT